MLDVVRTVPRRGRHVDRAGSRSATIADGDRPRRAGPLRPQYQRRPGGDRAGHRWPRGRRRSSKESAGSISPCATCGGARTDPAAIGQILVATPERRSRATRLSSHTSKPCAVRASSARRENERQITVRTNIRDRDQGGFVSEAQAKVAGAVTLPSGYRVSWGGQFENLARARARLALILPVTIVIVFGAAVRGLRIGARCRAGARQCAVLARRRNSGAVSARHPPVGVGGRWIRDAVRRCCDGWAPVCRGNQSASGRAGSIVAGCRRVRRKIPGASDVHADCRRDAGNDSRRRLRPGSDRTSSALSPRSSSEAWPRRCC